jgi:hypothetical protein
LVILLLVVWLYQKTAACDAAIYLQDESIKRILREMIESLFEARSTNFTYVDANV